MPETTTTRKQPQDRKPKQTTQIAAEAGISTPYEFDHDDETYTLPTLDREKAAQIHGEIVRDAIMSPEDGTAQIRLGITTLEAMEPEPKILEVLYSKPWGDVQTIVMDWMTAAGVDPEKL